MARCHSRIACVALAATLFLSICQRDAAADGAGILIQRSGDRLVLGYDTGTGGAGSQGLGGRAFGGVVEAESLTQFPSFLSLATPPVGSQALPVGQPVFWDFLPLTVGGSTGNLLHWSGVGTPEFSPAEGASLSLFDVSFAAATVDGAAEAKPGLRLGTTTSSGVFRLHSHRLWFLDSEPGHPGPAGVYLAALRVRMEGLTPTEPFFVAIGDPSATRAVFDQAVPWAEAHADSLILAGDYTFDGLVDEADRSLWASQFGARGAQPVAIGDADGNLDGVVDAADYTVWRDARRVAPAAAVAVPEPAGLALWGGAAVSLLPARAGRRSARPR